MARGSSLRLSNVAAEHDPLRLHDKSQEDNTELDAIAMNPRIKWGHEVARTMAGYKALMTQTGTGGSRGRKNERAAHEASQ